MNRRIQKKRTLENTVREQEMEILGLHEEISMLRLLIEDRDKATVKYIKEQHGESIRGIQHLTRRIDNEEEIRRHNDNCLRVGIADLCDKVDKASLTFIGKKIFK